MNAAVLQIQAEVHALQAQIDAHGGTPTRAEKKLLRAMRDRLVLAGKGER